MGCLLSVSCFAGVSSHPCYNFLAGTNAPLYKRRNQGLERRLGESQVSLDSQPLLVKVCSLCFCHGNGPDSCTDYSHLRPLGPPFSLPHAAW